MGIQGLLTVLKPLTRDVHMKDFKNKTAAVDVMNWLYKGAYSCAYELCTDTDSFSYLAFPLKMLKMLRSHRINTICVFDGIHLKAKEETEKTRRDNKMKNRLLGETFDTAGKKEEARKYYGRSMTLKTRMIDLFMDILERLGFSYIVAPYEADAQISYMCREGIVDFAISEDSDLLVYGCPNLVMKLTPQGTGC